MEVDSNGGINRTSPETMSSPFTSFIHSSKQGALHPHSFKIEPGNLFGPSDDFTHSGAIFRPHQLYHGKQTSFRAPPPSPHRSLDDLDGHLRGLRFGNDQPTFLQRPPQFRIEQPSLFEPWTSPTAPPNLYWANDVDNMEE